MDELEQCPSEGPDAQCQKAKGHAGNHQAYVYVPILPFAQHVPPPALRSWSG